jgi:hypothetical protein
MHNPQKISYGKNTNGKGQIKIDNQRGMILSGFISPGSTGIIHNSLKLEYNKSSILLLPTLSVHWLRLRRHVEV